MRPSQTSKVVGPTQNDLIRVGHCICEAQDRSRLLGAVRTNVDGSKIIILPQDVLVENAEVFVEKPGGFVKISFAELEDPWAADDWEPL